MSINGSSSSNCYYRASPRRSQSQHFFFSSCPSSSRFRLPNVIFLSILLLTLPAFLLLHSHFTSAFLCSSSSSSPLSSNPTSWSGDLRVAEFSWNHLRFDADRPPPVTLKLAVFSRKWPLDSSPGGMERHALTLHSALGLRGHRVHVFTSAPPSGEYRPPPSGSGGLNCPVLHFVSGDPGHWRPDEAWAMFQAEDRRGPFDVVHSESVALPYRLARGLPNLAVSWHGIALEIFQSTIYQDLARDPEEPISPAFNRSIFSLPSKLLAEIRFFRDYAHHVAISDSCGEMLRDVYQMPSRRVHVILNGVDERQFRPDRELGMRFREEIGVPTNATLVLGVAGRLVKDKGHPLLHAAFGRVAARHPGVWLVVAGTGPWESRYEVLGGRVVTVGALPPTKLRAFYNSVDVFVNPTLRPQGLDLTLMEAMQCGRPVAATRFPSIKGSIVVDAELGHMFAPNVEALVEALEAVVEEGSGRLEKRGRACADYARDMFTATKMALAYERLFLCIRNETYCKYPSAFD